MSSTSKVNKKVLQNDWTIILPTNPAKCAFLLFRLSYMIPTGILRYTIYFLLYIFTFSSYDVVRQFWVGGYPGIWSGTNYGYNNPLKWLIRSETPDVVYETECDYGY